MGINILIKKSHIASKINKKQNYLIKKKSKFKFTYQIKKNFLKIFMNIKKKYQLERS